VRNELEKTHFKNGKRMSQNKYNVERRESRTELAKEEREEEMAEKPKPKKGSIGVETPEETPGADPIEEELQQFYHCASCGADMEKGDAQCPTCERAAHWEGVA